MQVIVQKYGGSSVADPDKLRQVARQVVAEHRSGKGVVVVVSAMGDTTEDLLELARCLSTNPSRRELDMLLSAGERVSTALLSLAVQELGVDAISLSGPQSGVRTDGRHFNAAIEEVHTARLRRELEAGRVVVVAGYQGQSPSGEVTTLGRGGSDTSAVAIAAALGADRCEICSDVEGVFSADPRIVVDAAPLPEIAYEEMLELARHGASVLNADAIALAQEHEVPIRARSTFSPGEGTLVARAVSRPQPEVRGVACHAKLVRVFLAGEPSLHEEVLEAAGEPEVYLDADHASRRELILAADEVADGPALASVLETEFGERVRVSGGEGSVSVVGLGVGSEESARRSFARHTQPLTVPEHPSFVSDHALTCLVAAERVPAATRHLHGALVGARNAVEAS